jgi:hypothetical protein
MQLPIMMPVCPSLAGGLLPDIFVRPDFSISLLLLDYMPGLML